MMMEGSGATLGNSQAQRYWLWREVQQNSNRRELKSVFASYTSFRTWDSGSSGTCMNGQSGCSSYVKMKGASQCLLIHSIGSWAETNLISLSACDTLGTETFSPDHQSRKFSSCTIFHLRWGVSWTLVHQKGKL